MTEQEWLASEDPGAMLSVVTRDRRSEPAEAVKMASVRQLRLFAVACCRESDTPKERTDLYEAEGFRYPYDDSPPMSDLNWARAWTEKGSNRPKKSKKADILREIVGNPFRPYGYVNAIERRNSPLAPGDTVIWDEWLTPIVLSLAQAAYDDRSCPSCLGTGMCHRYNPVRRHQLKDGPCPRCEGTKQIGTLDPHRLAVLSDALEEAGCASEGILRHLRGDDRCGCHPGVEDCGRCHSTGWRDSGPHVRGCHVIDALLGKS